MGCLDFVSWPIHKLRNLWSHHSHYCTLESKLSVASLEAYVVLKKFIKILMQLIANSVDSFLPQMWNLETKA